jgi:hypothetical protein
MHAWLRHLRDVEDVKPSTLRNYGFMLAEPGTPHRRSGSTAPGWIIGGLATASRPRFALLTSRRCSIASPRPA